MDSPQRFLGSSRVTWNGLALPVTLPCHLGLMFRTRHPHGLLLHASAGPPATATASATVTITLRVRGE